MSVADFRKLVAEHEGNVAAQPKPGASGSAAWLRTNDPDYRKNKRKARRHRRKAAQQAKTNPALVAKRMRALHLT